MDFISLKRIEKGFFIPHAFPVTRVVLIHYKKSIEDIQYELINNVGLKFQFLISFVYLCWRLDIWAFVNDQCLNFYAHKLKFDLNFSFACLFHYQPEKPNVRPN